MAEAKLSKLEALRPEDWVQRLKLDAAARRLLEDRITVEAYVRRLAEAGQRLPAVTMLAYALPKREAVWWACTAARHTSALFGPEATARPAIEAAEGWVRQPIEATRRLAERAAKRTGTGSPAGLAALAAFWSGGSLAPANVPAVPPPDLLSGKAVLGAVKLAAMQRSSLPTEMRLEGFLDMALDIATGGNGRSIRLGAPD
jgi:hypothetical protein